jgi:endonuclease IV
MKRNKKQEDIINKKACFNREKMLLGFHYSIADKTNGVIIDELEELATKKKIDIFQIFLQSPKFVNTPLRKFTDDDIAKFKGTHFKLIIHLPYNIPVQYPYFNPMQIHTTLDFIDKINKVKKGTVLGLVFHVPSKGKSTSSRAGLNWMVKNIGELTRYMKYKKMVNTQLYLETLAHDTLIKDFDFRLFYDKMTKEFGVDAFDNISFCLDTAHLFCEGTLDFRVSSIKKFIAKFEEDFTKFKDFVGVLHLNGSSTDFSSKRDIHTPIYDGKIPELGLITMAKFCYKNKIPIIVERSKFSVEQNLEEIKYIKSKVLSSSIPTTTKGKSTKTKKRSSIKEAKLPKKKTKKIK